MLPQNFCQFVFPPSILSAASAISSLRFAAPGRPPTLSRSFAALAVAALRRATFSFSSSSSSGISAGAVENGRGRATTLLTGAHGAAAVDGHVDDNATRRIESLDARMCGGWIEMCASRSAPSHLDEVAKKGTGGVPQKDADRPKNVTPQDPRMPQMAISPHKLPVRHPPRTPPDGRDDGRCRPVSRRARRIDASCTRSSEAIALRQRSASDSSIAAVTSSAAQRWQHRHRWTMHSPSFAC